MSLIPFLLDDFSHRPSRIFNQNFGLGLDPEDLTRPLSLPEHHLRRGRIPFSYYRPWKSLAAEQDVGSTIALDKDRFQVNLDVQHFKPEEIVVKVTGDHTITVEGKHEEMEDEHGYISRSFTRKYILPKGHDIQKVDSKLSSDGVLTITAPTFNPDAVEEHRKIPVQQTGAPSKAIHHKKEEKKN
ncbi:protein lethal(2)essential for life-like [Onthophagus taurus]|uniref:protein lethal(2)essential for life-like n=1 Tax=Onthophagus taurus TaxID=166361 RepID=UPI0039BDB2AD